MSSIRNTLKTIGQESLTAEKVIAPKPSLGEPKDWLRASEVIELYPIGLSTLYYYRKKGTIKQWKKVSPRVSCYSRAELNELFNPDIVTNSSVEEVTKVAPSVTKRRKRIKPKTTTMKKQKHCHVKKSVTPIVKQSQEADDKMITDFVSKKKKLDKDLQEEQAYSKLLRKKRKKLPPAKEGVLVGGKR